MHGNTGNELSTALYTGTAVEQKEITVQSEYVNYSLYSYKLYLLSSHLLYLFHAILLFFLILLLKNELVILFHCTIMNKNMLKTLIM